MFIIKAQEKLVVPDKTSFHIHHENQQAASLYMLRVAAS